MLDQAALCRRLTQHCADSFHAYPVWNILDFDLDLSVSVLQSVDLDGEIRALRREEIHPGAVSVPAVFVYLRVHGQCQ